MSDAINILKPSVCFEVQRIIGISNGIGSCKSYQVQWAPSWISGVHLVGCEDLIEQFETEQTSKEHVIKVEEDDTHDSQDGAPLIFDDKDNDEVNQTVNLPEDSRKQFIEDTDLPDLPEISDEEGIPDVNLPGDLPRHRLTEDINSDVTANISADDLYRNHVNNLSLRLQNINDIDGINMTQDSNIQNEDINEQYVSRNTNSDFQHFRTNVQEVCHDRSLKSECNALFESNVQTNDNIQDVDHGGTVNVSATFMGEQVVNHGSQQNNLNTSDYNDNDMVFDKIRPFDLPMSKGVFSCRDENASKVLKPMFQCNICEKMFSNDFSLKLHSKLHTAIKEVHACAICYRKFASKLSLQKHQLVHNSEKQFTNASSNEVADNVKVAKGAMKHRPHQCTFCTKTFPSTTELKRHIRVHTGERPYECIVCHKRFKITHHLKKHLRTHSQERPSMCGNVYVCGNV